MPIQIPDDAPFSVHVIYNDREDEIPTVWSISNPTLATIGPHPEHGDDSTWAQGQPSESEGPFVIVATDGVRSGMSEELHITPGVPAAETVEIAI